MLMCSVGARPLWRARWLLLFQHVVSMTPFFFFFLDWKKYLYRSLLPQTEPTAEWNKPVLPSLWAARVTLGNVGNHRLNIKYWVVVRKKKKYSGFHRWNVSSRGRKSLFFLLKITTRRKNKTAVSFLRLLQFSFPNTSGHYPGAAQRGASRTLLWVSLRGKRWEAEVQDGEEECTGGRVRGREAELRSGGWKGERYRTCLLILQFVAAEHEALAVRLLQN